MPRGFRVLCAAWAHLPGRSRGAREPVLHVGRLVQHLGAGRERADRDRQPVGFIARAGRRQNRRVARALSDGLFHQGAGRPHRRPERRLEGPLLMGEFGQPHPAAYRGDRRPGAGRPRRDAGDLVEPAGRAIPAAPRPARALGGPHRGSSPAPPRASGGAPPPPPPPRGGGGGGAGGGGGGGGGRPQKNPDRGPGGGGAPPPPPNTAGGGGGETPAEPAPAPPQSKSVLRDA